VLFRSLDDGKMAGFFETGYTTLPGLIHPQLVSKAKKISNFWIANKSTSIFTTQLNELLLTGGISSDVDVMGLFYCSPLVHVTQRLVGQREIVAPSLAQIVITSPALIQNSKTDELQTQGQSWHVEGFTSTASSLDSFSHSPYTLLIGVALTDISHICIHPGSPILLQESVVQQISQRNSLFSEIGYSASKPNLGLPMQLSLRAGDVFLCTQKMAMQMAANNSDELRIMVFFRISHVDHAVLKGPALEGIWVEYKGFQPDRAPSLPPPPAYCDATDILTTNSNSRSSFAEFQHFEQSSSI